jgi:hypothetical protein
MAGPKIGGRSNLVRLTAQPARSGPHGDIRDKAERWDNTYHVSGVGDLGPCDVTVLPVSVGRTGGPKQAARRALKMPGPVATWYRPGILP